MESPNDSSMDSDAKGADAPVYQQDDEIPPSISIGLSCQNLVPLNVLKRCVNVVFCFVSSCLKLRVREMGEEQRTTS